MMKKTKKLRFVLAAVLTVLAVYTRETSSAR